MFNGPVNFTTEETNYNGLVLFRNIGANLAFGESIEIRVNGVKLSKGYRLKVIGTDLVLEKKDSKPASGMVWVVAKRYTMPDGQPGVKLQRIQ